MGSALSCRCLSELGLPAGRAERCAPKSERIACVVERCGVEIRVLGSLLVVAEGGVPVVQRSARQRLLLAVLIAGRGRTFRADELVESLWPDALPADPAGALQSQVSRLRRQLGQDSGWIETMSAGYRLVWHPDGLDVACFECLLADARQADDEPAVALELVRDGPPCGCIIENPFGGPSTDKWRRPHYRR